MNVMFKRIDHCPENFQIPYRSLTTHHVAPTVLHLSAIVGDRFGA
jgi:hypothetical protein